MAAINDWKLIFVKVSQFKKISTKTKTLIMKLFKKKKLIFITRCNKKNYIAFIYIFNYFKFFIYFF